MSAELLAGEARRRLGPVSRIEEPPSVSIVVLNRNGAGHLRRLLGGLAESTDYAQMELILVDNGSSDDSLDFIRGVEAPFPISIVANHHNESFSDGCNQGAELATGELLLLLNNDTVPFEPDWLNELVACWRRTGAGIVGPVLLRPAADSRWGYVVQHRAIEIVEEDGVLGPDRSSYGGEPFGPGFGEDEDSAVPPGACMLIERKLFELVGGLTHGYVYGGEDIDLGLKALSEGRRVVCSGRSLLLHDLGSTRERDTDSQRRRLIEGNRRLFWERWGPRLRRERRLKRLATRQGASSLGFCLKSGERTAQAAGRDGRLKALGDELTRRGHRWTVLCGETVDGLESFDYEVAVHLAGPARFAPRPSQFNVLWLSGEDAVPAIERSRYDLALNDGRAGRLVDTVLHTLGTRPT